MFGLSLKNVLKVDALLIADLSTFESAPAIFENRAPAKVEFNYLVFTINNTGGNYAAVDNFDVTIDFFGYELSGVTARRAVKRIVDLLDRSHLSHDDYSLIRLFKEDVYFVETPDIKSQHYNVRFSARAVRSGWMGNF